MTRLRLQPVLDWIKGVITQPREELDRWERAARFLYDLGIAGARQLRRDRAPQMAGALAFRTLFGLLPVLVMGALVIRVMRGPESFVDLVTGIFESGGLYEVGPSDNSLGHLLGDFVRQAAHYNASAIGWIGLAVLIYAAISMMVTIENCFNTIYRAPEGRSWMRRIPTYWFLLTVGPVAIGASIYVNGRVEGWIEDVGTWEWLIRFAVAAWTFILTWLLLLAVYMLVPNTTIRVRPAMMGAFVSALLYSGGRHVLGAYLANAVSVAQFGGSLGLIPLFMFWVYVMWLVVLFGLEVSSTLQALAGRRLEELAGKPAGSGLVDPAAILSVMSTIAAGFEASAATPPRRIAEVTGIAESTVRLMIERLAAEGFVHRLDRDDGAVVLARPPDKVDAARLLDIGYALVDPGHEPSPVLERLREAQRALAGRVSLSELLPAQPVAASVDQGESGG